MLLRKTFLTPVTQNSFSLRSTERAENLMVSEHFQQVQSSGCSRPFSKCVLCSVSLHIVCAHSEERNKNDFEVSGVLPYTYIDFSALAAYICII